MKGWAGICIINGLFLFPSSWLKGGDMNEPLAGLVSENESRHFMTNVLS